MKWLERSKVYNNLKDSNTEGNKAYSFGANSPRSLPNKGYSNEQKINVKDRYLKQNEGNRK